MVAKKHVVAGDLAEGWRPRTHQAENVWEREDQGEFGKGETRLREEKPPLPWEGLKLGRQRTVLLGSRLPRRET